MITLPSLPSGWKYVPVKRAAHLRFSSVNKHSVPGETDVRLCNYVDVYRNERITQALNFMAATATAGEIARFSLTRGDVLLTKDSETPDDIGVPACVADDLPGVVCGYHLAMLRPRSSVDGRFLHRALQASGVRDQFHSTATGVTRFGIGLGDVGDAQVPIPPLNEQRAIADFLDSKTAAIDGLIGKKEQLLSDYAERRRAVIHSTVMHGVGRVDRRSTGTVLGDIPLHWHVKRLMHLTPARRPIMYGIVLPGPNVDDGVPLVKSGNCTPSTLRIELLHRTTREIETGYARSRLAQGDIVYAIRGSVGMAALVPEEIAGANLTQDAARIAPGPGVNPRWLLYVVQSPAVWGQLEAGVVGATVKGINIRDLKRPLVPVPPRPEQDQIAAYLDKELGRLGDLEAATVKSIEHLREYRQALITAAVTGQVDVKAREAA